LNGIIDRIEQESDVRKEFLTDEVDSVDELSLWETAFNSLFIHPL